MHKFKYSTKIQILKAKIFGKRAYSIEQPTKTDKGCETTGYWLKGVLYVTNFSEIPCLT